MIVNPSVTSLKYRVKEEDIDINLLNDFHLCISIATDELSLAIINTQDGKCLLGEKHAFETTQNTNGLIHCLEEIYDDHHLLRAGFWGKITVALVNDNFTYIPNSLFEEENTRKYLELHNELGSNDVVTTFNHKSFGATSIFAVDEELLKWFKSAYPNRETVFIHQTSAFIEGVLHNSNASLDKQLFINCEGKTITICVLVKGKLEYCNNFNYNTPQDVIYFTLFVMQELYLNADKIPTVVWGDLNTNTPVFVQLFKYIRNIKLGTKPKSLKFGYMFDDLEDNQLFNTYNISLCEK